MFERILENVSTIVMVRSFAFEKFIYDTFLGKLKNKFTSDESLFF